MDGCWMDGGKEAGGCVWIGEWIDDEWMDGWLTR